jgi:hypothetical protein
MTDEHGEFEDRLDEVGNRVAKVGEIPIPRDLGNAEAPRVAPAPPECRVDRSQQG